MPEKFNELYEFVQTQSPRISRALLVPKIKEITGEDFAIQMFGFDINLLRGFFLSATIPNPSWRVVQLGGKKHVILIARGMTYCWTRFVQVKEMMHLFDSEVEKTSTGSEVEDLLTELAGPANPAKISRYHESEYKAMWMALAVLCPEKERAVYARKREAGMSDYDIADELKIPEQFISSLLGDKYKDIIQEILDE
ncbi:MAG: hypothetical protein ABJQ78_13830 [Alloalcanivorax sp.]